MPGPRNSKKQQKYRTAKDKNRSRKNVLQEDEQNAPNESSDDSTTKTTAETRSFDFKTAVEPSAALQSAPQVALECLKGDLCVASPQCVTSVPLPPHDSFIVDPGNGPRVTNMKAFLSSFFCPSISVEDGDCILFAPSEIVTVLEAILPRELALVVWYNKTRTHRRICPACQRLYCLGDSLLDPITDELIDVGDPRTPPHIIREQQLSGFCSFPCFYLASYSSHPYTIEVASGAWGLLSDEIDPQVCSLLDATDPKTAAVLRYGLAACTPSQGEAPYDSADGQGLGRVLRLTRRKDLGLGDVLEALAWYEKEREDNRPSSL